MSQYELLAPLGLSDISRVFRAKSLGVEGFEKTVALKLVSSDLPHQRSLIDNLIGNAKRVVRLQHANISQLFDIGIILTDKSVTHASIATTESVRRDIVEHARLDAHTGGERTCRTENATGNLAAYDMVIGQSALAQPCTPKNQLSISSSFAVFVASEYVDGCSLSLLLREVRKSGVTLPLNACLYIALQVAKALAHAHQRRDARMKPMNIVHGGICPNNILLSREGQVKVSDFAMPQRLNLSATTNSTCLTDAGDIRDIKFRHVDYISPEHKQGRKLTEQSDVFSLALVLYEMVTGVNPVRAATYDLTLQQLDKLAWLPMRSFRNDVPEQLETLVKHALEKDLATRITCAREFFEQLHAIAQQIELSPTANFLADYLEQSCNIASTATIVSTL